MERSRTSESPHTGSHGKALSAAAHEGVAKALDNYQKKIQTVQPESITINVVVHPPPDLRIFIVCVFIILLPIAILILSGASVEKHIALTVGLSLIAIAVALSFTFRDVTPLQRQILLALFALAGGAIATEIPGFLDLNVTVGQKTGIAASGALAVFVLLYLFSARKPPD